MRTTTVLADIGRAVPPTIRGRLPASWVQAARTRLERPRAAAVPPIHLLHIGKTGGTALKSFLTQNRDGLAQPVMLHRHRVRLWDIPRGEPVLFVVRDPASRFASGFSSRQRQGRPAHVVPWSRAEALAFERFSSADELASALSHDDPARREEAFEAMQAITHVSTHLSFWLGGPGYLRQRRPDLVWIGRQESLEEDLARLAPILGLPRIELSKDPSASHVAPETTDRRLSAQALANLRLWYAADVQLLEACERVRERQIKRARRADRRALGGSDD